MANVEQAIARSKSHNEIVTIEHDAAAIEALTIEALTIECDDHVETAHVHEFWGTDEAGNEWRVHVSVAS